MANKSKFSMGFHGTELRQILMNAQRGFNTKYNRESARSSFTADEAASFEKLSWPEAVKQQPPFQAKLIYTNETYADGGVNTFSGPPYCVQIGLGGLEKKLSSDGKMLDLDVTRVIVAMQHEFSHLRDTTVEQMKPDSELGAQLCISEIAAQYNRGFYSYNYSHNLREIRAEHYGIQGAREFISGVLVDFGKTDSKIMADKMADECLLQYVNFRAKLPGGYYISSKDGREFKSMDEVNQLFSKAESDFRTYDVNYPKSKKTSFDVSRELLHFSGMSDFSKAFDSCKKLADAEKCIAGLMMYADYNMDCTKWPSMAASDFSFVNRGGRQPVVSEQSFKRIFGFEPSLSRGEAHNLLSCAEKNCDERLKAYWSSPINAVRSKFDRHTGDKEVLLGSAMDFAVPVDEKSGPDV